MAVRVSDTRRGGPIPGVLEYAYWREWQHKNPQGIIEPGVLVFNSRPASNRSDNNLLPKEPNESFWDDLCLGIRPFFCFIVESLRIACRWLQTKRSTNCYRFNRSIASHPKKKNGAVYEIAQGMLDQPG